MKLVSARSKTDLKGRFGGDKGVEYDLHCKLEITPEEQEIIETARLGGQIITSHAMFEQDYDPDFHGELNVDTLLSGTTASFGDLRKIMQAEADIKRGCLVLKGMIEYASTFGVDQIEEI